jgi:hypothetical protein
MANGDESEVLRYLRSIDAKLGRLNEQLEKFLSAPKSKRAASTKRKLPVLFTTTEAAEEHLKTHPDDDVAVIHTGVPRAADGFIPAQSPELNPEPSKKRSDSNAD